MLSDADLLENTDLKIDFGGIPAFHRTYWPTENTCLLQCWNWQVEFKHEFQNKYVPISEYILSFKDSSSQ